MKYYGGSLRSPPSLQIPGWAGGSTADTFQPWTHLSFVEAATSGVELLYPYEDVDIPEVVPPFVRVSDLFFLLNLELSISTPYHTSLLILPHYRFYTDASWETPIPVATMIQTDWYPFLTIMFKSPPKVTKFRKGEPFAQAIVVPRESLEVKEMTKEEIKINQAAKLYIKGEAKHLITRSWVTSSGFVQDNLYEVLAHLEHLPEQIKPKKKRKFRLI